MSYKSYARNLNKNFVGWITLLEIDLPCRSIVILCASRWLVSGINYFFQEWIKGVISIVISFCFNSQGIGNNFFALVLKMEIIYIVIFVICILYEILHSTHLKRGMHLVTCALIKHEWTASELHLLMYKQTYLMSCLVFAPATLICQLLSDNCLDDFFK